MCALHRESKAWTKRGALGSRIAAARQAAGMSQEDLARAIWVSRNTVSNWETGNTAPDAQSLILLSALFGMSVDDLLLCDANLVASALARDRGHVLVSSPTRRLGERGVLRGAEEAVSSYPLYAGLDEVDMREQGAPPDAGGFKLARRFRLFNRSVYLLEELGGGLLGTISRKKALWYPVLTLRIHGFERVTLKRDMDYAHGFQTVYRVEGEDLSFRGNLLGASFEVLRRDEVIARVAVNSAGAQRSFSVELPVPSARPLAVAVVMAVLLMRDYDGRLVRE